MFIIHEVRDTGLDILVDEQVHVMLCVTCRGPTLCRLAGDAATDLRVLGLEEFMVEVQTLTDHLSHKTDDLGSKHHVWHSRGQHGLEY